MYVDYNNRDMYGFHVCFYMVLRSTQSKYTSSGSTMFIACFRLVDTSDNLKTNMRRKSWQCRPKIEENMFRIAIQL